MSAFPVPEDARQAATEKQKQKQKQINNPPNPVRLMLPPREIRFIKCGHLTLMRKCCEKGKHLLFLLLKISK